jgi:antitoxin (DNA-binding transcriptional repressor) of toxin-antitoxin stability system
MTAIPIEEIQRDLLRYLSQVEAVETLVVTRVGQPVAEIKPVSSAAELAPENGMQNQEPRPFGLAEGEFEVPPDFDDPLPEEILRLFEGEDE